MLQVHFASANISILKKPKRNIQIKVSIIIKNKFKLLTNNDFYTSKHELNLPKNYLCKKFKTMYKYLLLPVILLFTFNIVKSQDTIVKTDESIIIAKVLEITQKQIKYKKISYLEGPTYSIPVHMVSKIIYPNGFVETYSDVQTLEDSPYNYSPKTYVEDQPRIRQKHITSNRKGVHISLLFAPTTGNILIKPDSPNISGTNFTGTISQSNKFCNAFGLELRVYTNNNLGVKTGIIFQNYRYQEEIKLYNKYEDYNQTHIYNYHVRNFGFPLQFSYSTKGTVAFTSDFGVYIGLPFKANVTYKASDSDGNTYDDEEDFESQLSNVIIHETAQVGLLFELSEKSSFSLGFYQSYSLMSYIETEKLRAKMYGAYFSLSFKFD